MSVSYNFKGKVALVTGAGSGMGLATAKLFCAAGAAVALVDVNEPAVQKEAEALRASGGNALGIACDVSNEEQVATMVDRTVSAFGRLDAAFNNAGIQVPPADAADETAENFDRVNAINLRGVWTCMKHELRQMREQGSGVIVNCSSLGDSSGSPAVQPTMRRSTG